MLNNTAKAHREHRGYAYSSGAETEEVERRTQRVLETALTTSSASYQENGCRNRQEDRSFIYQREGFLLCGVFDGHGGPEVAQFVNEQFASKFAGPYETPEAVHAAFYRAFKELEQEIEKDSRSRLTGSTAVTSYIDLKRGLIYTATLGDSEAKRYRKDQVAPLSTVRDWKSPKDRLRHQQCVSRPDFRSKYPTFPWPSIQEADGSWTSDIFFNNPKFSPKDFRLHGLNVARAFGDSALYEKGWGVIHKPKITVAAVNPGDVVLLSTDGLIDQLVEREVVKILEEATDSYLVCLYLVKQAVYKCIQSDNVTVVAVRIGT